MAIPSKIRERLVTGLKRFVPIVQQQIARDVSEADTVTLVKDLLSDVFGYDKYSELTSEHSIRGTYCDLAVRVNEKLVLLIEVKSAGTSLDSKHIKQAIDYGSNQGCEWIILTNGSVWQFYQILFLKPIDKRLLFELDITKLDVKKEVDLDKVFLLTKEGYSKGQHIELRDRQDATNRYLLAALITSNESVISVIRRELRRIVDVVVEEDDVIAVLKNEVIKRDSLEGPDAEQAARKVSRGEDKQIRKQKEKSEEKSTEKNNNAENSSSETVAE